MVARPSKGREFHEFFKVYYPDQSSTQLRLPPACAKYFSGTIPRNVKLVDLSGKSWQVEIKEVKNIISFKKGWEKFANDHSLRLGNFLVFRYNGNSVYNVTIFGTNGCVNEEGLAKQCTVQETSSILKDVRIKEEPEEDGSCPKPALNRGSQRTCVKLQLQRSEKDKARRSREVTQRKTRRIGPMTSGLCGEFTMPTNPHFITVFRTGNCSHMNIPRKVLNEIEIELEPEMVLRVEDGGRWPVRIHTSKDGRTLFCGGWAKFARDNKLKSNDECMFEFRFLEGRRRLSNEVRFQVLHANGRQQVPRNKAQGPKGLRR